MYVCRYSRFGHGTQEDSHEVLRCLISILREEEIEVSTYFDSLTHGIYAVTYVCTCYFMHVCMHALCRYIIIGICACMYMNKCMHYKLSKGLHFSTLAKNF